MRATGASVDYLIPDGKGGFSAAAGQESLAGGGGNIAMRLLQSGFDVQALRTNDVLRKEEWLLYDQTVIDVARQRLVAVADLMSMGLRYDIPNGLGTTQIQWELASDMTAAEVSMSGVTQGQRDRLTWSLKTLPLPIVHKEFSVNIRALEASRKRGEPLDMAQASLATRLVAEKLEDIVFNGHTITVSGQAIEGFLNASNRNTGGLTSNVGWASATATGDTIVKDIIGMIQSLQSDNMYGPYGLYVPLDAYIKMADDYKANSDRTILERVLAIPGISFVRPSQNLPGGTSTGSKVVLWQTSADVIDIVNGMQPTTVQWDVHGGMMVMFKVMAILIPRVKYTASLQSGIHVATS